MMYVFSLCLLSRSYVSNHTHNIIQVLQKKEDYAYLRVFLKVVPIVYVKVNYYYHHCTNIYLCVMCERGTYNVQRRTY